MVSQVKVGLILKFCEDPLRICGDIEGKESVTDGRTIIKGTVAKFI